MKIAKGYDMSLLAALLRGGGRPAPNRARNAKTLHLEALATIDIVTAGKVRQPILIRANDNW